MWSVLSGAYSSETDPPPAPELRKKVRALGGTIQSVSREYRSTIAWIPLRRLERLAEDPAVRAIEPAAEGAVR